MIRFFEVKITKQKKIHRQEENQKERNENKNEFLCPGRKAICIDWLVDWLKLC